MSKSGKIVLVVALLLIIGVGAYALMRDDDSTNNTDSNGSTSSSSSGTSEQAPESSEAVEAATITYTDDGFSPATITVKSGGSVIVTNESSETVGFKSDPHPVHTENTELNIDDVDAGQSRTFTVTTQGTWGYHNHYNASQAGTIVVE